MGIYIFNTDILKEYLEIDALTEGSANDFGKNIIPAMLAAGEKMFAYSFEGYWKDVGTISSLWEANMDLIGDDPILSLADQEFRIYSKNTARSPQYVGCGAVVDNSLISEGCRIYGTVINSVVSGGVVVEEGAIIKDSVIMEDKKTGKDARVYTAIIDSDTVVEAGAVVGVENAPKSEIALIASGSVIAKA